MQVELENARLKDALTRAAFVLHKIASGDPKALENAEEVAGDSVKLLRELGVEDEWMEYYNDIYHTDDPAELEKLSEYFRQVEGG